MPGRESHAELAPVQRLEELKNLNIESRKPRWAGVVALFYPETNGQTTLMLIHRKTYKGVHSNQVGFPGGKTEPEDKDLQATAVRECEEEVGVPRERINIVKKMTPLYIPPSNFWVQSFLGYLDKKPSFIKEDAEVEALIPVPLKQFLDPKNRITKRITTSYAVNIEVPAYNLQGFTVWGATAMMLAEIQQLLNTSII